MNPRTTCFPFFVVFVYLPAISPLLVTLRLWHDHPFFFFLQLFVWQTSVLLSFFVLFVHIPRPFSLPLSLLCTLCPVFSTPPPSSLCILDHFLSFQVSGPVEADNPSPGGTGPSHCLRSISLSLCSRYAHSPHPVGVGRWGRGAGRPQARRGGHLLQQQTLMMLLVLFTLSKSYTHAHTHTHCQQHTHRSTDGT